MSELTEGQMQALRDAYTTLRAIRQTLADTDQSIVEICATSEYLLVAEFPEVKELEAILDEAIT